MIHAIAELADLLSCCTPLVQPQLDEEAAVELERLFRRSPTETG